MIRVSYITLYSILLMLSVATLTSGAKEEEFSEELLIRPLPDGNIMSHFQFTSTVAFKQLDQDSFAFLNLFPKAIAQVVQEYGVEQFKMFFTQGRWNNKWGAPVLDAPSGVQLIASFLPSRDAKKEWKRLSSSLSGMFCSSVNALDSVSTAEPRFSFPDMIHHGAQSISERYHKEQTKQQHSLVSDLEDVLQSRSSDHSPTGLWNTASIPHNFLEIRSNRERQTRESNQFAAHTLRYGEMPEEAVCTENLTPWLKLLPCRDQAGLGLLLAHPLKIYDSLFHSMGTTVRFLLPPNCTHIEECQGGMKLEVIQTLTTVHNTKSEKLDIAIAKLFGERHISGCQLSEGKSRVFVELPNSPEEDGSEAYQIAFDVYPKADTSRAGLLVYFVSHTQPIDLHVARKFSRARSNSFLKQNLKKAPVIVQRHSLGYGEVNAGVYTQITNTGGSALNVTYFDHLPWYLPVYFHSLRIFFNGTIVSLPQISHTWRFQPGEDHSIPSVMEIMFTLPADTTAVFTYQYDKAFLQWTEHPPDAHRGVDVASACVTVHYNERPANLTYTGLEWSPFQYQASHSDEKKEVYIQYYTDGLLVLLPTPDFSMPYNVITLTCTIFAIIFTTTVNVLTRRFSYITRGGEYNSGRLSMFLYRKIRDYVTQ